MLSGNEEKMECLKPSAMLKSKVDLLHLIRKYKLPLSAFKDFQAWAQASVKNGHSFPHEPRSREK